MRRARSASVVVIVVTVVLALAAPLMARPLVAAGTLPALRAYAGAGMILIDADAAWTTDRAVTLKLNASSMGGTVTRMRFSVDRATWTSWESYAKTRAYTLPAGDGAAKVVFVQFENSAGDRRIDYDTIGLDSVAPKTTDDADLKLHDEGVTVSLTATDATSGVAAVSYRLDGGAWQSGASVTIPAPADTVHAWALDYHATDAAGNAEALRSCTVKIDTVHDTTVPVTTSTADAAWHDADVTVSFSVAGPGAPFTVRYRVDGGPWQEGTELVVPAPADHSNDGAHALTFYAVNAWDNAEDVQAASVNIDTTAPTTADNAPPEWSQDDVTLTLTASDALSPTITRYRLDGGSWQEGTSLLVPANPDKTNDGIHTVDYYSSDAAGNTESAHACQVKINVPAIAQAFTVLDAPGLQRFPALSGDTVVWQDDRNGGWDIYGSSASSPADFSVCTAPGDQTEPAISGDVVVWADRRGADSDIYAYDFATATELPVCTASGAQTAPAISGETIVWTDTRSGAADIYAYDLASGTEFPVCTAAEDQTHPGVSGNTVVWCDERSESADIYGYDLAAHVEYPICRAAGAQTMPEVSNDKVVWTDARGSAFAYDLTLDVEYPLNAPNAFELALSEGLVGWNDRSGALSPRADYATGRYPGSVAVGDFDDDGVADLVTGNPLGGSVSVLLGRGDGRFSARIDAATGGGAYWVAVGDLDVDGMQDVAVASGAASVGVLLGRGDGTFEPPSDYGCGLSPYSITIGDFNDDGAPDLATANVMASTCSVLLGHGDGTFADRVDIDAGGRPYSVVAVDLNGDAADDLAAANEGGSFAVMLSRGDGTFAPRVLYGGTGSVPTLTRGDFNGDGAQDLAMCGVGSGYISVLLNNGDGSFTTTAGATTSHEHRSIAAGDLDGDGVEDLVTVVGHPPDDNWASVLLGNGDGTFATNVDFATGRGPYAVAVGDFDGDRMLDVATANQEADTVSVLLGRWPGVSVYNLATDTTLRIRGSEDAGGYAGRPALDGNTVVWANHGVHGATLTYPQWTTELEILPEGLPAPAPLAALGKARAPAAKAAVAAPSRWIRTHAVGLALAATSDQGQITEMALSDGGVIYGAWEPYAASRAFTLSPADGVKTVAAVFRDSAGLVSPVASATIGVDTKRPVTTAYAATATRGRTASLRYRVSDAASTLVWHTVQIKVKNSRGTVVKKVTLKRQPTATTKSWKFTCKLAKGTYRYYVYATDAAGNKQSRVGSARFVVK